MRDLEQFENALCDREETFQLFKIYPCFEFLNR